jgi:hypothetical protein
MTVHYTTSKRSKFIRKNYRGIVNGTRASASLLSAIPKNQTWLAYEDPGAVNFFPGPVVNLVSGGTTEVANVRVEVPPGCTHIEMWFLLARQLNDDPATAPLFPPVLVVTSAIDTKILEDIQPTSSSVKVIPRIMEASWYSLKGIDDTNQTGALKVRALPVSKWTDVWVTVAHTGATPGLHLFSAYYRTLPPESTLAYEDGV